MGNFGFFFFSEQIAQLKAFRKTLTDPAKISEVDKEIADLEAKKAEKQGE
jgi:hypothetical protein